MTGLFVRQGRPPFVAQLDLGRDPELHIAYKFHDACTTLCYRDIMALSRALNVSQRAIESWKYAERMPSFRVMWYVIRWVKQGKPMTTAKPGLKTGMI
jgi:hypothetical protein